MSDRPSPVQRYSLGLDPDGKARLVYDMQGEIVRFPEHLKALNTERTLSKLNAEQSARDQDEPPSTPAPPSGDVHSAHRALKDAIQALRELGWSDGDIVFAGELTPGPLASLVDLEDPASQGEEREPDVEDAFCVEEFLRKVLSWEGSDEDELAEAIEAAEKLVGALDTAAPDSNQKGQS